MLSSALDTSPPYLGRAGHRRLSKKGRREGEGRGEACLPARSGAVQAAWRPRPAALPERRGPGHASCCPDVRVACPWVALACRRLALQPLWRRMGGSARRGAYILHVMRRKFEFEIIS